MSGKKMNTHEEVTWVVTQNTVKDRMIELSLIHKFSDSRKFKKSTRLLNKLIEKYRNLNRYNDYVKMKKLIKQKICVDIEVEDDENFGEDDYSILHRISMLSKKDIKKCNDTLNSTPTPSIPSEIKSSNIDLSTKNRKRVRALQANKKNDSDVPVKKKRLKSSPKQCLKKHTINEKNICELANNGKDEKQIDDFTNKIKLTKDSNSLANNGKDENQIDDFTNKIKLTKNSNPLAHNERDEEQIDNFTNKINIMEDKMNIQNTQTNNLQSPHKHSTDKNIYQHLSDTEKNKVVDHVEISNVNHNQESVSHNKNNIVKNVEDTSHDINKDVIIDKQDEVICNSNMLDDNIMREESESDLCSHSIVLQPQKSPPKVKFTEIINKKYKIINKENSDNELSTEHYNNIQFLETSTPLSLNKSEEEEESQENEGYADSVSSSVLSQSEKRMRQLKMLNLSLESNSSSSEEQISQQKDNLSEITVLHESVSTTSKESTTWSKLKLNRSNDTHHKKDKPIHNLKNITNDTNCQHNVSTKDLSKHRKVSPRSIEPEIQTFVERPYTLKNFITTEELVQDKNVPAFTLSDLSKDDEVFLIDMPITVQTDDLQGQKILLKNKLLKLGKNKYDISYKDIPVQSCVFSTCKDSEPYKMINVKPKGSIIVKRKLFPVFAPKKSYYNIHKNK